MDTPLCDVQHEVKVALTRLAYAMQLLDKTRLSIEDYQTYLKLDDRKLTNLSGVCSKQGNTFSFSHNNFQEYLIAKHIAPMPLSDILSRVTLSDGSSIDTRWINILTFILQLRPDDDLIHWFVEHDVLILVKAEPSRVPDDLRYKVLSAFLNKIRQSYTWFDGEICDESELVIFTQSANGIDLLLAEIVQPTNFHVQYFALRLIRHLTNLFKKHNEIRDALAQCYQNEQTRAHERQVAFGALGALSLATPEMTHDILQRFEDATCQRQ